MGSTLLFCQIVVYLKDWKQGRADQRAQPAALLGVILPHEGNSL